jgi:hypothetical protein
VIAAAFLIGGLTNALWNVVAVSLRQRITPDRILGRINSSYRLVAWGTRPLAPPPAASSASCLACAPSSPSPPRSSSPP